MKKRDHLISGSSTFKYKFHLEPSRSVLVYGGVISIDNVLESDLSGLFHIIRAHGDPSLGARLYVVNNIKYFRDKVMISSCEEALSFVRLLTAPLPFNMEDYLGYEVLIKESFSLDDHLGRDVFVAKNDSGWCAVVSKADADKLKIQPAICTKGSTYRISRYIYQWNDKGLIEFRVGDRANIYLIQEEVTAKGGYRILKKTLHKHNVNAVKWDFPIGY